MRPFALGSALVLALAALASSCGDNASSNEPFASSNEYTGPLVTPVPRPANVPKRATSVEETTILGRFERRAHAPPIKADTRLLEKAYCERGVMAFITSKEAIYAARGCDGFWTAAQAPAFLDKEVAIRLERTDRFSIVIETAAGAQARFTVGGIWVEPVP